LRKECNEQLIETSRLNKKSLKIEGDIILLHDVPIPNVPDNRNSNIMILFKNLTAKLLLFISSY